MWLLQSLLIFPLAFLVTGKPVEVTLEAPWHPVGENVLALETLSKYNSSSFFPVLSLLINERMKQGGIFDNEADFVFNIAEKAGFLKPSTKRITQRELQLGTVIPEIQAHYETFASMLEQFDPAQSMKECPVVMWTEDTLTCDKTDLFALQAPAHPVIPRLHADDRVIGNGDQWLVVYADLDSPEFPSWHEVLLEMALSGRVSYVLRHRPSLSLDESSSINLAGYAMSFDLKQTDYLVVDDRLSDGEQLKLDMNANNKVPKSKIPALGYALARNIRKMDLSDAEKFDTLQKMVFNIPAYTSSLSSAVDDNTIEEEKEENSISASGFNAAFLDGVLLKSPDIFNFYDDLHRELSLIHTLSLQMPEGANIADLLTSGFIHDTENDSSSNKKRYNLMEDGGTAIAWLNDIEKDIMYEGLPDDLVLLKESLSPFAPIRRNMHSVVVVGDFNDRKMLAVLYDLVQQMGQQIPLQIGIISSTREWRNVAKFCGEARQAFIIKVLEGTSLTDAAKYAQDVNDDILQNPATSADAAIVKPPTDPQEFYDQFGVDPSREPAVFVNGFLLPLSKWMQMATIVFESDADYLRNLETVDSVKSLRDALYATGEPVRNKILDPLSVDYVPWALHSPMQVFKNPDSAARNNESALHAVVFSSKFDSIESFYLAEELLRRAHDDKDLDIVIRPLKGANPKFYASLMDESYNMFRFSRDLFAAARGHLFEQKTEPRVFTVSKPPTVAADDLPVERESLIIDGRYIDLDNEPVQPNILSKLIDRETQRVEAMQKLVPGIGGIGIAALTSAATDRTTITRDDGADIFVDSQTNNITLTLVIDPATPEGQKYMTLGIAAKDAGLKVSIFLSPSPISEIPKKFYHPVLDRHTPAVFTELSEDILYSAELVEPAAWMTFPLESKYDPDNVVLNMVKEEQLTMKYNLDSILVQGYASGPGISGSSVSLNMKNGTKLGDTNIMSNLGYFQLQAHVPGYYDLCLDDGRMSFETNAGSSDCIPIAINSYHGATIKPMIRNVAPSHRKPEKSSGSVWKAFKKFTGIASNEKPKNADVNIFTIASGHLYERFASIMMLSVMKHSQHTVKFWLIENFMSPDFKEFLPHLAEQYHFDYEFVSYKWPSWLRSQSEKQREIWGYKILFLDVLFPQTLSDVIFVDSDQIVRTDLKELIDLDLEGAPYAFTPMGDDREEMEPYRFWNKGFWKDYLLEQGKKYHISALYRVDLNAFRRDHVGDTLRQYYQRLSADPKNLANLDQDLPNYLQPHVPIYSLPPEWLWCETWCSDERLATAKTIDLCNNPLTKEPKLQRARRQISEWTEYDNTVAALSKQVRDSKEKRTSAETVSDISTAPSHSGSSASSETNIDDQDVHQEL